MPRTLKTMKEHYDHFHEDPPELKEHRLTVIADALKSFYTEEERQTLNPNFTLGAFFVRDIYQHIPRFFERVDEMYEDNNEDEDEQTKRSEFIQDYMGILLRMMEHLSSLMPKTAAYEKACCPPKGMYTDATQ